MFEPLLAPSRYKGAYGGRGSGKSHFFAELLVEDHIREPGLRSVCIREVQKSLKESAKRLVADKIDGLGVGSMFNVLSDRIETPGDGVIIFQGMQDHTADSIKSLEGFGRAWVEEAQTLSERSLQLLRPTIRAANSELWFSWNPRRRIDPVDVFLRGKPPKDAIVVSANWDDNPFFPDVLEQERSHDYEFNEDQYGHVWEGEYATVNAGAYFAKQLALTKKEGRISKVSPDPLMTLRAYWDIGGTGAKSDACAIWVLQFVGREVRVLNYYETVGQPLSEHVGWLRENDYEKALCVLPHDGETNDRVYNVSYESYLKKAGFKVKVIPNQGKGAVSARIEAVRRIFPSVWFNEETTAAGREALGWYHEKVDEARKIGLGPNHDWSSHGADAFGMAAVDYEQSVLNTKSSTKKSIKVKRGTIA